MLGGIKRRQNFLAARAYGSCRKPSLVVQFVPRHDTNPTIRFGLTATVRTIGNAVRRNRARRRLRHAAHAVLPHIAHQGYDYVLIARAGTLTSPWHHLTQDLSQAITTLHASHAT